MMVLAGHAQIETFPQTNLSFLYVPEQLPSVGIPLNSTQAQKPNQIILMPCVLIGVLYMQSQCVADKSSNLVGRLTWPPLHTTDDIFLSPT